MTTSHSPDADLLTVVEEAWKGLFVDVQSYPEIVKNQERNVLVHFGHHILSRLEQNDGLKPLTDVSAIFDSPRPLLNSFVVIWAAWGRKLRPDIVLRRRQPIKDGVNAVVVELKCIRTITTYDHTDDIVTRRKSRKSTKAVLRDIERLRKFTDFGDGKTGRSVMCVLHLHEPTWGNGGAILSGLPWSPFEEANGYEIRQSWQVFNPKEEWELD